MSDLRSRLKADPADWLLEAENPSVRYLALRDLMGKPEDDPELAEARKAIGAKGPVPLILEKREAGGYWGEPEKFYRDKYRGTSWQVLILAELMADGTDARVREACEFILACAQDRASGGFSADGTEKNGGRHSEAVPCLTGNMAFALIRLGYLGDERLMRAIDRLCSDLRTDDGETIPPAQWPYDKYEICYGRHSCFMGVVKALKALAEIPPEGRSDKVRDAIARACEFLLVHRIFKKSHDLSRISKPGWLRFGFPLMYQTDALEILEILTRLGYRDERMDEAVELLLSKQDLRGRWTLANSFNGQFQVDIEKKGGPSKWITLNALRVIKRYSR